MDSVRSEDGEKTVKHRTIVPSASHARVDTGFDGSSFRIEAFLVLPSRVRGTMS